MKTRTRYLSQLALCLVAVIPATVSAAPPSTSPYYTDTTNSYVQDQTTQTISGLNGVLCEINAMAPAKMVNLGDYIALVDLNTCNPNDGGGQAGNTNSGADYQPMIVNSSRVDNNSPMIAKVWMDDPASGWRSLIHLSATQAPNPPADPYGRFRMDFCSMKMADSSCPAVGFIASTASGLEFYENYTDPAWGSITLKLKLNATGSTAGSGALEEAYTGASMPPGSAITFAYNADYFRRSDGMSDLCFDRSAANAAESVWSYGLYDSTTGAHIERNTGFPIEYTDLATQTIMNGYVGYWGLSAQTTVDTSKPVNQVTYSNGSAVKTPYTLMQTGGKLIKHAKISRNLSELDKIRFHFEPSVSVASVALPTTPASTLTAWTSYEIYWNQATQNFVISAQQDQKTYNYVPYATPVTLSISDMKAAAPYGIYGYSNMLGGDFTITSSQMATLGPNSQVQTLTQDVVYPSEFAALGGMKCLSNCPTAADIALSNAATVDTPVSPFAYTTIGWAFWPGRALYNYTLNASTGNLMDAAAAAVISTATSGNNWYGINSGHMVATTDLALLNAAVLARTGRAAAYNYTQADIDTLPTYYEWQTGPNWMQLTTLKDASGAPVRFDPPLDVTYVVPSDTAKYGTTAGAAVTLQYSEFGNLWGIPSSCIDSVTNLSCTFSGTGATAPANQRWTPEFSIPNGSIVTAGTTSYLVKALQKEVRLAEVPVATCEKAGLTVPGVGTVPLPGNDPTVSATATSIGAMPTFNPQPAPRVIHGVKMY
jgi:hypothetical protein